MFETKKGAINKMLKEANKIQGPKRFEIKMQMLCLAEEISTAAGDLEMIKFISEKMSAVQAENQSYNLANGLVQFLDNK